MWTSPRNAILIVEQICEQLCELDAGNEQLYRSNCAVYQEQLRELDAAFVEVTENAQRRLMIFGDRFPFLYFAQAYGLDYYAAFPGCAEQTESSAATIVFLMEKVKEEGVPVVFCNELSAGNEARVIAEYTGAEVLTFYACHNISRDDMATGVSYLSLMWTNVASLKQALN